MNWTQREGSKRWILESDQFPSLASFGVWNNSDENKGKWHVILPGQQFHFLDSTTSVEQVKKVVRDWIIQDFAMAIQHLADL